MSHDTRSVFHTEWFSIEEERHDDDLNLEGKPFYTYVAPDAVMILALTDQNEIVMVEQFRPSSGNRTIEFPAGGIDESESAKQAATRELYEETGYVCDEMTFAGIGRNMMNRAKHRQFCFLGTGATRDKSFANPESLNVLLAKPSELKSMVKSGKFQQLAALALLVMSDWNLGTNYVEVSDDFSH